MKARVALGLVAFASLFAVGCGESLALLDDLDVLRAVDQVNAPKIPAAQANLVAARYQAGDYPGTINNTLDDLVVIYHFTYMNGVTLHALALLGDELNVPAYQLTVAQSLAEYDRDDLYRASRGDEPIDYMGSMSHATIAYGLITGDTRFESNAIRAAGYFLEDAPRTPDGLLAYHDNPARGRIWADALYMVMPLLAKAGVVTQDTTFWDEALAQIQGFSAELRNEETGLYHQGRNWHGERVSPGFWGRANGWVAAALAETLDAIPPRYPGREDLLLLYQDFMASLADVQGPSGMWHQLLNDWDSYPESSGTGLIMYAMARGVERGWLDESYADVVANAYDGLTAMISLEGDIRNVSPGTPTQRTEDDYRNRGPVSNDAHGVGPVLLGLYGQIILENR